MKLTDTLAKAGLQAGRIAAATVKASGSAVSLAGTKLASAKARRDAVRTKKA
jgi:hypothetical protein